MRSIEITSYGTSLYFVGATPELGIEALFRNVSCHVSLLLQEFPKGLNVISFMNSHSHTNDSNAIIV